MDTEKQENYALLHDDSDLEDYDQNKASQMKSQNGTTYQRRPITTPAWAQPRWLCHTVFIVILISSQITLGIYILMLHKDMETLKLKQPSFPKKAFGIRGDLKRININNTISTTSENLTYMHDHTGVELVNLQKKANIFEMNMKSVKRIVSSHEEDLKVLQAQIGEMKYENAKEREFNNMTRALNSLQNRLEESLGIVFSQISQLRDDIYFIENAINYTKEERLGETRSSPKPTQKEIITSVAGEAPFTTSQTMQTLLKSDSTPQILSWQTYVSKEIYQFSIPLLKSRTDFQVFFYGADKDANGYLTYDEIKNVLGEEAPNENILFYFDEDKNRMYSYTELIKTFLLTD